MKLLKLLLVASVGSALLISFWMFNQKNETEHRDYLEDIYND